MKVKKYEDLIKIVKELEVLQKESKSFICAFCGKRKEDTKIFGDKRICKSCVARMEKVFPKEKVKDTAVNILDAAFFMRYAGTMFFVTPIVDSDRSTFEVEYDKPTTLPKDSDSK